jgi:hypothetical protein
MTTGLDVVSQALYKAGITGRGITPSNADTQDALADWNDMIEQWNQQRWLVWDQVTVGITGDGRTTPYTVGPGGDISVTPRPNRVYSAFVRQLQNVGNLEVDTPLKVIDAMEEYNRINTKTLASFPEAVFLQTSMPLARLFVYPWPSPAGQYAVYITLRDVIPVMTLSTDLSALPQGYTAAFKFNLARRVRQSHGRGLKPDPELNKLANDSLDVLMGTNLQVPEMGMPVSLLQRGSGYNLYSDQFGN